nr:hypothetical protein [Tanacetum cinerariifolium]
MLHLLRVEMVINSPWMLSKNWLVQKQTAFGKDISNPFVADNLPNIVWFSTHHVTFMKSWLVQKQTALGKNTSNPLIVDSLLKPIWFSIHHHLTIEVLAIPGQTATSKEYSNPFMADDVTRLQALVDKKKIVISEVVIREILQLDDAEGVNQVADLSTHTTRFISPALTQKVFANMRQVGKVDDAVAAAVQENVAEDVTYDAIPSPPSHDIPSPPQEQSSPPQQPRSSPQAPPQGAQFPTHIQQILDVCSALTRLAENLENDKAAQKLEILKLQARVKRLEMANQVKSSKLRCLRKVGASRRIESSDDIEDVFNQGRMIDELDKDEGIELVKDADIAETEGRHAAAEQAEKQAEIYHLDLDHPFKVLSMQEDDSEVQKVVEVVTTAKLITDVVTAASQVSAASATISAAKPSILVAAPTVVAAYTRRRKGVIIRDPEEKLSLKTPTETPKVKDKDKGILVETPKPMKKKDQIELDAEYARKLHEEINRDHEEIKKDIDWDAAIDHSWLVQKQTALGKDTLNPLIVDSLLKTIWFSIHHHLTIEVLAIPGQTATGVDTPRSDEDRLKLMELMVFLLQKSKSDAAEGFEQIIDFLSGSYIHYALTVNPHIYISCIKQFWNTASVKCSDDVTRLQALVDKKKIVISENQVADLSTHTTRFISPALTQKVFANIRRVGKGFSRVETPLFEGMLAARQLTEEGLTDEQVQVNDAVAAVVQENVAEDGAQFPTHIQQILDVCSALTRRVENLENDKAAQKLEILKLQARVKRLEMANQVKSSKLRRLRKVGASRRIEYSDDMEDVFNQGRMIDDLDKDEGIKLVKDDDIAETEGRYVAIEQAEKQAEIYHLDLDHRSKVLSMQEDDLEVQEVVEVVTTAKLITDVVTAASQVSAASVTISAAKPSIPAAAPIVVVAYTRRRKGVIIRDPEEELSLKTPTETPKVKDKDKGILVETPKPMKKKDQIKLDAEYARKLHEEINRDHEEIKKDIDWDAAIDHVN